MLVPALFLLLATGAEAHSRWKCPTPRDHGVDFDNTGNKNGPCGPLTGQWGKGGITTLAPGPQTIVWEESISHKGSPWRVSILDDNETVVAVLADHIPHWDESKPHYMDNKTYTSYHMTVDIPDVACEKCTLQLLNIMTDKTHWCNLTVCTYYSDQTECSGHTEPGMARCLGASSMEPCKRADTCFSSYHSCTDVVITGKTPIKQAKLNPPVDWPYHNLTSGKYSAESAAWEGGWLKSAGLPAKFFTPVGACGSLVATHTNATAANTTSTAPEKDQQQQKLRHGAVLGGGRR